MKYDASRERVKSNRHLIIIVISGYFRVSLARNELRSCIQLSQALLASSFSASRPPLTLGAFRVPARRSPLRRNAPNSDHVIEPDRSVTRHRRSERTESQPARSPGLFRRPPADFACRECRICSRTTASTHPWLVRSRLSSRVADVPRASCRRLVPALRSGASFPSVAQRKDPASRREHLRISRHSLVRSGHSGDVETPVRRIEGFAEGFAEGSAAYDDHGQRA